MSGRNKQFLALGVLVPVLTLALFVPVFFFSKGQEARALSSTQWETVRKALDGYITSQFKPDAEGEAGFVMTPADLKARLDSNVDGSPLSEGDDAANVPVLVDVYSSTQGIPGSVLKSTWNSDSLAAATINTIKSKVDAHVEAGFSTDVVAYCVTGHTEAPVTGGYGAIAQVGGFSSDSKLIPKVYALKWGRQGWTNGSTSYNNSNALGAASAPATYANASNSACGSATTDLEAVRCSAENAISSNGGNVGNGINPPLTGLPVDVRAPSPSSTVPGAVQIPINKLFNDGLKNLNPLPPQKLFVGRTQHVEGIAAVGAEMLGYDSIFLKWGMPNYNNTQDEKTAPSGPNYSQVDNYVDTTPPQISNVVAASDKTSVTLTWKTDKPATSIVSYSEKKGGPYTKSPADQAVCGGGAPEKCTVLRGNHSVKLTNMKSSTDYYCQVTSFDGTANKAVSNEISCPTSLEDKTPPALSSVAGDDYTISANYSDPLPSSGIDALSLAVTVDGKAINECWADGTPAGKVTCSTPAGLGFGSHSISLSLADNFGNKGTASGSFNVMKLRDTLAAFDSTPPTTSGKPTTWQNKDFFFIMPCDDGSGQYSSGCKETHYSINGGAEQQGNTIKIDKEGDHPVTFYSIDNKGNSEGKTKKTVNARLDKTAPQLFRIMPAQDGEVDDSSTVITADYGDSYSGVNPDSVKVAVDGNSLTCTKSQTSASCPASNLAPGKHIVDLEVMDQAGNTADSSSSFYVTRQYNWTWYDDRYLKDWVLTANPDSNKESAVFNLKFGPATVNHWLVSPGKTVANIYPGMMSGPVKVTSEMGQKAITSQRSLMGDSFEEVLGTETTRLSDHFYWTWYDYNSSGYKNWILISNPATGKTVHAAISFTNASDGSMVNAANDIAPGASWTPVFPGKMGGPVEVTATGGKVMASQRVLSQYGAAFNEVPGVPAEELSDTYYWTWYDMKSAAARNWILIANPSNSNAPIYYDISIDGNRLASGGPIAPGRNATPMFPGRMGGPVTVATFSDPGRTKPAKAIASQRVTWGPSFEEVPGSGKEGMGSDYYWTWYDMQSPGVSNWVLIANPGSAPVDYAIKIGGKPVANGKGSIPPKGKVTPVFPGKMDGPVEVWASGNVITSQRVLWNGFFNEVQGTQLK